MAKLSKDFDWRRSHAHIYLLSRFINPHDVDVVKSYSDGFQDLKESVSSALERLIRDGALEDCSLADKIAYRNKVTDLRPKLKLLGLKTGGTKDELIQRLIEADARSLEKEYNGQDILICSKEGVKIIDRYEKEKDVALMQAKHTVFACLQKIEIIPAKKAYMDYLSNWDPSRANYPNDYQFHNLRRILEKPPKRLTNKFEPQVLTKLLAIAAMKLFWRNEPIWEWLSDNIGLETNEIEETLQLIERYQQYLDHLDNWTFQHAGIHFGQDDPNVCDNCRKLEGVKPKKNKVEEWPFEGCTNPIGCLPLIGYEFEEDGIDEEENDFDDEDDSETDEVEGPEENLSSVATVDFLGLLRQLKEMVNDGLITDDEYKAKKIEILSRM